jgi:sulfur-carrier protein
MEMTASKVIVKAFGMVAEVIGSSQIQLSGIASVQELQASLFAEFPGLKQLKFSIAINKQLAEGNQLIPDGSEIALLPPFSGG